MRTATQSANRSVEDLRERWIALHASAAQLARLAGIAPEPFEDDLATFPDRYQEALEWQRELVWRSIDDIDAIMQPGVTALRTITSRGRDASAPALTLWREFFSARNAVRDQVVAASEAEAAEAA
ncbi:MAG: hypothetical protein QNJ15_09790 [Erythrobacter sp.]|nr:hypothetical protein [Erythrobacter sp.]